MRILLAFAAFFLLATFAPLALFRAPQAPAVTRMWYEPVALDGDDLRRRRVGGLVYLGGWALRSNDIRYGGISAIHVEDGALLALSDAGFLFKHALPGGAQGLPVEVRMVDDAPDKRQRDTEAMSVDEGRIWVVFERRNRIARYQRDTLDLEAVSRPAAMREWYSNSGGEALARLPGGRFLVVSERSRRGAQISEALLFEGDPADESSEVSAFAVRRPEGYRVTDAAPLPDGRILFLLRRFGYFEGISAKLMVADVRGLVDGTPLLPKEVAHFAPPLTVDNLEGLRVTEEQGRTIVWIASDDNFTALQRTLLLKFALAE